MKVAQLITMLRSFDPELYVFVDGYEGGLQDPGPPESKEVYLNVQKQGYYGPHELVADVTLFEDEPKPTTTTAVIISRRCSPDL